MDAAWVVFFLVLAVGLTVEAVLARRRRRVLPRSQLPIVLGLGALGVATVLARGFGDDGSTVGAALALWVLAAFVACVVIDVANRRAAV